MYSCVSLLLLAGNLSREHMIRITIVRLVGKVHFRSDYDILGHDKASFPKIRFIRVGYVIVKDFCQVSISFSLACSVFTNTFQTLPDIRSGVVMNFTRPNNILQDRKK